MKTTVPEKQNLDKKTTTEFEGEDNKILEEKTPKEEDICRRSQQNPGRSESPKKEEKSIYI